MLMSTPAAILAIDAWQKNHAGQLVYDEEANTRLDYKTAADLLTPTDCSGNFIRLMNHYAPGHLTKATYTGNMAQYGKTITTSKADVLAGNGLLLGDAILFDWSYTPPGIDHVAWYAGDGKIRNHGGPGKGPDLWELAPSVNDARAVQVVRYIEPTTAPPEDELTPADLAEIKTLIAASAAEVIKAVEANTNSQTSKLAHGSQTTPANLESILAAVKALQTPKPPQ